MKTSHWTYAILRRICSAATLERVVDPIVADWQHESACARREGRRIAAAWIRARYSWALCRAVVLCTAVESTHLRLVATTMAALVVFSAWAVWLPMSHLRPPQRASVAAFVYLIPQALNLALTLAVAVGIAFTPGVRLQRRPTAMLGIVCAGITLANVGWLTPAANQQFRILVSGYETVHRGVNELTLPELWHVVRSGWPVFNPTPLDPSYWLHARLAIIVAPLAFGAMLAARPRRAHAAVTLAAFSSCYVLWPPSQVAVAAAILPAVLLAWAPVLLVAASAAAEFLFRERGASPATSN